MDEKQLSEMSVGVLLDNYADARRNADRAVGMMQNARTEHARDLDHDEVCRQNARAASIAEEIERRTERRAEAAEAALSAHQEAMRLLARCVPNPPPFVEDIAYKRDIGRLNYDTGVKVKRLWDADANPICKAFLYAAKGDKSE